MPRYEVLLRFHGISEPEKYCEINFPVYALDEKQAGIKALRLDAAQSRGAVHVQSVIPAPKRKAS